MTLFKLMGFGTHGSKIDGSQNPMEPMLTEPLSLTVGVTIRDNSQNDHANSKIKDEFKYHSTFKL